MSICPTLHQRYRFSNIIQCPAQLWKFILSWIPPAPVGRVTRAGTNRDGLSDSLEITLRLQALVWHNSFSASSHCHRSRKLSLSWRAVFSYGALSNGSKFVSAADGNFHWGNEGGWGRFFRQTKNRHVHSISFSSFSTRFNSCLSVVL